MSVVLRLDHGAGRISLPLNRRAHVRDRIAAEIERLVDMLDVLDGDADAEPELGWPADGSTNLPRAFTVSDDREDDAGDDREPDEDREPILGWTGDVDQAGSDRFGEAWQHDEAEESDQPAEAAGPGPVGGHFGTNGTIGTKGRGAP